MSTLALPLNYHERARILGSSTLYEASHLACAVDSGIVFLGGDPPTVAGRV